MRQQEKAIETAYKRKISSSAKKANITKWNNGLIGSSRKATKSEQKKLVSLGVGKIDAKNMSSKNAKIRIAAASQSPKATLAQVNYLVSLGVVEKEAINLNRSDASKRIDYLVRAKSGGYKLDSR